MKKLLHWQKKLLRKNLGLVLTELETLIKYLFGKTSAGWTKTELLIFITPYVVTTQEEIMMLTTEYKNKTKKLREMIEESQNEN